MASSPSGARPYTVLLPFAVLLVLSLAFYYTRECAPTYTPTISALLLRLAAVVLLPVLIMSLTSFLICLLFARYQFLALYLPVPLLLLLLIAAFCGLSFFLIQTAPTLPNWGAGSMDSLLGDAIDWLKDGSQAAFHRLPIRLLSSAAFAQLVMAYAEMSPVSPSVGSQVEISEPAAVDMTTSIGADKLIRNHHFLPTRFPRDAAVKLAGRGKQSFSRFVNSCSDDNLYFDMAGIKGLPKGLYVRQFGDDTVGISLPDRILVVADGVGGSKIPEDARYASSAAVLLTLLAARRHPSASIFSYASELYSHIQHFLKSVDCGGATTLTIAQITPDHLLRVLHLGDSCCSVIRDGQMVFSTEPLQHFFNAPYILAADRADTPRCYEFYMQGGDKVLLYSDGVSDNLWPKDIASIGDVEEIAAKAVEVFTCKLTDNIPFAKGSPAGPEDQPAKRYYGKLDDVSIIGYTGRP